jgi:UDP-glucose 4-epimerase
MTVLVTGGAGYVGSHCVKMLQKKGYQVVVFDNFSTGHKQSVQSVEVVEGELHDIHKLTKLMKHHNITAVIHFAAFSQVAESVQDPMKYYYNNVSGTLSLLKAMQNAGVTHFIFSSTAAVYGSPNYTPIDEAHPKNPVNPYGHSKKIVEDCLNDLSQNNCVQSVIFRYFNAAGASPDGDIGECHTPETHLIPNILKNIVQGQPVNVYGNNYDTVDGTCIRDYVHVNDIVAAHVDALEYLKNGGSSTIFNLGSETGTTVLEVIKACELVVGKNIQLNISPRRQGDPSVLVANCEKVKRELGYQAKYTNIVEIIKTAWAWEQQNGKFGQQK